MTENGKIKIEVKAKHIKNGKRQDSFLCPIALAVQDQSNIKNVCVICSTCSFDDKEGFRQSYLLPRSAKRFIVRFDSQKQVNPFNFFLKFK